MATRLEDAYSSVRETAEAEKVNASYVARILKLSLLARTSSRRSWMVDRPSPSKTWLAATSRPFKSLQRLC
jgi:hypothetical protein